MLHNTTAFTPTTTTTVIIIIIAIITTATKAKTATINFTSTGTIITTGATTTTNKLKGIKAKILGNIVTILKSIKTRYAHISCQEDVSAMLQAWLMVLSYTSHRVVKGMLKKKVLCTYCC